MLKKIFVTIISLILIGLIGLGLIGYYIEYTESKELEKTKAEEKVEVDNDDKESEESLVIDINKLDISQIPGYTPGEQVISTDEEDTASNDTENNKSNTGQTIVGGITLPYNIEEKNMEIVSIGQYSGKFVEDGSDMKKENVLAMIVKNTSEEVINYGEINIKIKGVSGLKKFIITNLKPGSAALVMESTGETKFNLEDKYTYVKASCTTEPSLSLMEDIVKVSSKNKQITIENLSDKDLNTVYVYYRNISPGNCYLGGITYRAKFEDIKANESLTINTVHLSNTNSEILKVEIVSE